MFKNSTVRTLILSSIVVLVMMLTAFFAVSASTHAAPAQTVSYSTAGTYVYSLSSNTKATLTVTVS